ncbi:MAG: histidine phosphatase family protein [Candidatus Woesearchaeota archaeon]|nr:histidine phosphatase family protein [Candidatus Woesearchaeota archaeon]
MLDLYFIRHAESVMNGSPHLLGGRSEGTPLSEVGKQQSQLLGKRFLLQGIKFHKIYSSPSIRAAETARLVGKQMGYLSKEIIFSDDLIELSQGDWEGRSKTEIYTAETLALINSDNWNFTPPNGESPKVVEERMLKFVTKEILPLDKDGKTISCGIFTHGVAIKCLLRGIMEFTPKITYRVWIDNAGIIKLQYRNGKWYVMNINDIGHLLGAPTDNT